MNIFKVAYKVKRGNSDEIYKGFGFRHLSDATQYYVHPNNQSYKGTTTLCQSIGEAISLLSLLLLGISKENGGVSGDIWINDDKSAVFMHAFLSEQWRAEGVVESNVFSYRALCDDENVIIAAYDENDNLIEGNMEHLHPLYKLLPAFAVLLAKEITTNDDMSAIVFDYIENPAADTFVNIHEDFYQNHKFDEYDVTYRDLKNCQLKEFTSYGSTYSIVRENRNAVKKIKKFEINKFDVAEFSPEQRSFIPHLGEEFVLPSALGGICNAVVAGDSRAVLLHGPAGTGKTISCKLICRETRLPIMETVNCTENLDEFVLGKFIPEGERIVFKESYVTKAIREGGAVVFEEINFAKPAHLAFLNSLLDDNGFVRLDNGETVKRHKNFRFFATMNLGYFGTKELNQALYNRFNTIVEIAELSDEAIKRMLITRVPECRDFADKILGVYHKVKKKIEAEELDIVISPRNLENWARLAKFEGYLKAAEKTIIPVAKCDRTLEGTIRGILMLYKWC